MFSTALNQGGELFDMSDSPFVEKLVAADAENATAKAARQKLRIIRQVTDSTV